MSEAFLGGLKVYILRNRICIFRIESCIFRTEKVCRRLRNPSTARMSFFFELEVTRIQENPLIQRLLYMYHNVRRLASARPVRAVCTGRGGRCRARRLVSGAKNAACAKKGCLRSSVSGGGLLVIGFFQGARDINSSCAKRDSVAQTQPRGWSRFFARFVAFAHVGGIFVPSHSVPTAARAAHRHGQFSKSIELLRRFGGDRSKVQDRLMKRDHSSLYAFRYSPAFTSTVSKDRNVFFGRSTSNEEAFRILFGVRLYLLRPLRAVL